MGMNLKKNFNDNLENEAPAMRLPSNLMFASDVLSGYSRNRFKLETTSSDTATNGRIITVNLPENALLDMKSLRFFFDCDAGYVASAGTGLGGLQGLLPDGAQSLISKVEVYVNGVQVQSGANEYNSTCKIKNIGYYNQDNQQSKGKLVNHAEFTPTQVTSLATLSLTPVAQQTRLANM